jgi:hypothetical protein
MKFPVRSKGKLKFHDAKEKKLSFDRTAIAQKSVITRRQINGQEKEIIFGHFSDMKESAMKKPRSNYKTKKAL